jgi:hypothetical protein
MIDSCMFAQIYLLNMTLAEAWWDSMRLAKHVHRALEDQK